MIVFKSFSDKLILLDLLVVMLAIGMAVGLSFRYAEDIVIEANTRIMLESQHHLEQNFIEVIERGRYQALQLAQSELAGTLLRMWHDNASKEAEDYARQALLHEFSGVLKSNPLNPLMQVRLIDTDTGRELARLNGTRDADGRLVETVSEVLQNKNGESYVVEGRKLRPGESYVSDFSLSREWGRIEQPIRPTIRFVAPIHFAQGLHQGDPASSRSTQAGAGKSVRLDQSQEDASLPLLADGLIVLNLDATQLLKNLYTPTPFQLIVTNAEGDILHHPDRQLAWRHEFGSADGFAGVFPEVWDALKRGEKLIHDHDKLYLLDKIRLDDEVSESFLGIILYADRSVVLQNVMQLRTAVVVLSLFVSLIVLLIGSVLVRHITRPINRLSSEIDRLNHTHDQIEITVEGNDEIARLAGSFQNLMIRLKERQFQVEHQATELKELNESLEHKVQQRTQELEAAEERARLLLDSAGEGICGIDTNGVITFINPAAVRMLGYTQEELVGANLHEMVHHSWPDGRPYPVENCPMSTAFREDFVRSVEDEVL